MARAQDELDRVIGTANDRLVTVADKADLPYMNALINVRSLIDNKKLKLLTINLMRPIPIKNLARKYHKESSKHQYFASNFRIKKESTFGRN